MHRRPSRRSGMRRDASGCGGMHLDASRVWQAWGLVARARSVPVATAAIGAQSCMLGARATTPSAYCSNTARLMQRVGLARGEGGDPNANEGMRSREAPRYV
eukprot:3455669-Alexandrium_andersonii.AAC.2